MGFLVGLGTGPAGRPERVSRDRSCRGQQLRPEAQFELVLQGSPQIVGFHYVLDITVVEIKTVEGNQHMLDGEFPLHFEGLANGVSQGAGSFASAPDSLANRLQSEVNFWQRYSPLDRCRPAVSMSSANACALHSRSYPSGGRLARHANVGIRSADSRLCSSWGVTAESSVTSGDTRTRWRRAGGIRGV